MKHSIQIFTLLLITIIFTSCSKDCDSDIAACQDETTDAGFCQAYFESWIYNNGSCSFVGYSGCSAVGFETQAACEECDCD